MSRDHGRARWRGSAGGGASYDPDAQAYVSATGELFPEALNALVLGIKAAGLWDNHIGSIKKAIGVPSLAASLIDLRNTAFNGTAVNTPGHSATQGWSFVTASSQYIDSKWSPAAASSKASQDSVHYGFNAPVAGGTGSSADHVNAGIGTVLLAPGIQRFNFNDSLSSRIQTSHATGTGHFVPVRSSAVARIVYRDGVSIASDSTASSFAVSLPMLIGARNFVEGIDNFATGRIWFHHAGSALDASQITTLTGLFSAYASAVGAA